MATRGWIGYDWFKLVVAVILAALLIILPFTQASTTAPASVAATAPAAAVPTTAPAVATSAPAIATSAPVAPTAAPAAPPPLIEVPGGTIAAGVVTLNGTGTPGQSLEVLAGDQVLGTATVGDDGKWSLPVELAAGSYSVTAQPVDGGTASQPVDLAVGEANATAPAAAAIPTIAFPTDGAQLDAGPFTMQGTGAPGQQIEVLDGDRVVGTATVGADGMWSLEITPADATAAYSARPAGSSEPPATAIRVTTGVVKTCAELAVGCQAWVTREGGLQLRMRAAPGTSAAIITRLPIGTQMELTEGPQPADGFTWFNARTEGGEEGWVAGEQVRLQPD